MKSHLDDVKMDGKMTNAWGHFTTARQNSGSAIVSQTWDESQQHAHRHGGDRSKRQQLLAWVCDPTFRNSYVATCRSLKAVHTKGVKDDWLSEKQVTCDTSSHAITVATYLTL